MSGEEDVVEKALAVLAERPSALVTDVDGTLSRIVPRPEDAIVEAPLRASLRRLHGLLDLVAVITGREEAVAREMVGVPELTYVGSYALDADASLSFDAVAPALAKAEPLLSDLPCIEVERKQVSFALHYRNCLDPERTGAELRKRLEPVALATATQLLEGKLVLEVAPAALPDKGTALTNLLDAHGIRGAIFAGDDLADARAFAELRRRRDEAGLPGLCIAVVDEETPVAVRDAADAELNGVDGVERFSRLLADRLSR